MKKRHVLLFVFCVSTTVSAMKNDQLDSFGDTMSGMNHVKEYNKTDIPLQIAGLPDVTNSIFAFIWPSLRLNLSGYSESLACNIQNNKIALHALPSLAKEIISLRSINKQFNTFIANNLVSLLSLNQRNKDIFLIRSLQAKVPYFIKSAVAYGADCNATYQINGPSALSYAVLDSYQACSLLISNGADVNQNKPQQTVDDSIQVLPIYIAIREGDIQMITLFVEKGADLNIRRNNSLSSTLLSLAVNRNDPEIVRFLLTCGTNKDYHNRNGFNEALYQANSFQGHSIKGLLKNKQIVELLSDACETLDSQERGFCG